MKTSIALASYNGSRFIEEQLASFVAQTQLPDELVVCDDGSSDQTVAIVERFAAAAPFPVRLERNPHNIGFNRNFERAMALTTGDVILISDQDDIWYPKKIASVVAALSANPDKLSLIHDEHLVDEDGNRLSGTVLGRVRQVRYPDRYFVPGNCTAHRRELLPLFLPFPEGDNYDGWIALVSDLLGVRHILEIPLQLYRRHGGNNSEPELAYEAPTLWSVAARYGLKDARRGWTVQTSLLEEALQRIVANSELLDRLMGEGRTAAAIARIETERARLRTRMELLQMPRWRRGPAVVRLWGSGFYRDFSGAKSAIKDALRR